MTEKLSSRLTLYNRKEGLPVEKPNFTHLPTEQPVSEGRDVALSNRVVSDSGNTSIMSMEGFDFRSAEVVDRDRELIQFEPLANRFSTNQWMKIVHGGYQPDFRTHKLSNEQKLWDSLDDVAKSKEVADVFGEVNLRNLSPYQAVYLISTLIKNNLKYDELAGLVIEHDIHEKNSGELNTADKWKKKISSPKKLESLANQRYKELKHKTAEELIEGGWGVCGQFSALASHLYDLLKERQEGLAMNGSYLLYWNEGSALQNGITETADSNLEEQHAKNLLVMTRINPGNKMELSVGVIDYTFSLGLEKADVWKTQDPQTTLLLSKLKRELSVDQTFINVSSAAAFIKNFGRYFGLDNGALEAESLSEKLLDRIDRKPEVFIEDSGYRHGLNLFSSLVTLSKSRKNGTVIEDINADSPRSIMFARDLYSVPAVTFERNGVRIIRSEYVKEFCDYLEKLDFNLGPRDTRREEAADLVENMMHQYEFKYSYFKNNLGRFFRESHYDSMLKQILRIIVEMSDRDALRETVKTKDGRALINSFRRGIRASNKVHKGLIEPELVAKFDELVGK